MKLKVIFLKKKFIILFTIGLIILIILILFILFILSESKSTATFSIYDQNLISSADLNGDGIADLVYIKTEANKYYMEASIKGKNLKFTPDIHIPSLGSYLPYWPMHVTFFDTNRDNVPEVFLQSGEKDTSLQHVFIWENEGFKDILWNNNNLIGFADSKNNKTPKFISAKYTNGDMNFTYYILLKNKYQSYTYNYPNSYLGKNTIAAFIKYIEALPGSKDYQPKDINYNGNNTSSQNAVEKLLAQKCDFIFEDGVFMDTKWNKEGEPIEVNWSLNFKAVSTLNKLDSKKINLDIQLKYDETKNSTFLFKIYKITLKN
ncbi:MAG TPA: VCBS repeat-containing protein [Clostridiaceae bacterium]